MNIDEHIRTLKRLRQEAENQSRLLESGGHLAAGEEMSGYADRLRNEVDMLEAYWADAST